MSWTASEKDCYPSGIETPYWIIGVGFMTSLLINSFILFSGQSLTTQIWNVMKSWLYYLCTCLCCCCSSNNNNNNSNSDSSSSPPLITQPDPNHISICAFWCCCYWLSSCCCCRSKQKRNISKSIKFPSIIKLSINKNIHQYTDDKYEYDEDEYDEELSMVTHRNTTIDVSIQEMMLNDTSDDRQVSDDINSIIAKYDISLTGSEISGYYKLLTGDKYKNYKYPLYESSHATLSGDLLLLHYVGTNHAIHGQIGWAISYSSFYGFRNEIFQSITNIDNINSINDTKENKAALLLNINNNYIETDTDEIKYNYLKLKGSDSGCVWKLCQLENYHNINCNESHIVCYDEDNNVIKMNSNGKNGDLFKVSTKLQLNGFSEITNGFMDMIDMNGNYIFNDIDVKQKKQKINEVETKESFDNLSIDSNIFPKIEMKENEYVTRSKSRHSLSSLFSASSPIHTIKHHRLEKKKKVLIFQHATNKDIQLFFLNKRIKFGRYHAMHHHAIHHHLKNKPKAAIYHHRLQQFIAYIPSGSNEEDGDDIDILDGANWRMITWHWKQINNLTVSTSTASMSYYFAQLLSVWILIIGTYQWYVDIKSFVEYYHNYSSKYCLWRQYECYAFIVTNTPNMKQLILIIGLIMWSQRVNTRSNYQIYLQKQTAFQKILIIGYFMLILFFIPVMFTHFVPLFIPYIIMMWIISVLRRTNCCTKHSKHGESIRHCQIMQEQVKQMNDVTISNTAQTSNICDFHILFVFVLWRFAALYFLIILSVPIISRIYDGIGIIDAFNETYNERKTQIYFENVRMGYEVDLDRLRLLIYWLL